MSALGQSLPIRSASVPNNVRFAPKATIIHPGLTRPLDLALAAESLSASPSDYPPIVVERLKDKG